MTTMIIHFQGTAYTLTDETSQVCYGEPVLVSPAGVEMRGQDVVAMLPAYDDGICSEPERPLRARDVVDQGEHSATSGETFRDADGDLTTYGHATHQMFGRFMRQ